MSKDDINMTFEVKVVNEWTIQLWDDPMPFSTLQRVVQEASNVFASYPSAEGTFRFIDPDMLLVQVEHPYPDE